MPSLSQLADVPGGQKGKLSFEIEGKGPGVAYSASILPALDKYLRACGFAATLVTTPGSETVTYAPASIGVPCLTIGGYEDGVIKTLIGARGNVKISSKKVGDPIMFAFEFEAQWGGILDGAILAPTFEATTPPAFLPSIFTLGAYSPLITKFDWDNKNKLYVREVPSSVGFLSAVITDRDPGGKFDPEMTTVATYDWYGKWKSGAAATLTIGPIGPQYNRITITQSKVMARKVGDSDRSGIAAVDFEFQSAATVGDDEISILFS